MICHSKKWHGPRPSSCHKVQRGGTEYELSLACMMLRYVQTSVERDREGSRDSREEEEGGK